jgi:hypothetical protein
MRGRRRRKRDASDDFEKEEGEEMPPPAFFSFDRCAALDDQTACEDADCHWVQSLPRRLRHSGRMLFRRGELPRGRCMRRPPDDDDAEKTHWLTRLARNYRAEALPIYRPTPPPKPPLPFESFARWRSDLLDWRRGRWHQWKGRARDAGKAFKEVAAVAAAAKQPVVMSPELARAVELRREALRKQRMQLRDAARIQAKAARPAAKKKSSSSKKSGGGQKERRDAPGTPASAERFELS